MTAMPCLRVAVLALGGGGMPGMQAYVFSRTLRQADCPGVIVWDNAAETLASLKAK